MRRARDCEGRSYPRSQTSSTGSRGRYASIYESRARARSQPRSRGSESSVGFYDYWRAESQGEKYGQNGQPTTSRQSDGSSQNHRRSKSEKYDKLLRSGGREWLNTLDGIRRNPGRRSQMRLSNSLLRDSVDSHVAPKYSGWSFAVNAPYHLSAESYLERMIGSEIE